MANSSDPDEREMAEDELESLLKTRETLWDELLDMTIGGEDANRSRCVMEIRAGTGGDEAALFARDLFEMYKKHCEIKGWKFVPLESSTTEMGGFKEVTISIEGEGCYRELAVRKWRPPRPTRARYRNQGPRPYIGCDRRGAAGTRGR